MTLSALDAREDTKGVWCCRTQASSDSSQGVGDDRVNERRNLPLNGPELRWLFATLLPSPQPDQASASGVQQCNDWCLLFAKWLEKWIGDTWRECPVERFSEVIWHFHSPYSEYMADVTIIIVYQMFIVRPYRRNAQPYSQHAFRHAANRLRSSNMVLL